MKKENYYPCAILFARMYGIAETLEERAFFPTDQFLPLMEAWAQEYINSDEMDIIHFFEEKIKNEQDAKY